MLKIANQNGSDTIDESIVVAKEIGVGLRAKHVNCSGCNKYAKTGVKVHRSSKLREKFFQEAWFLDSTLDANDIHLYSRLIATVADASLEKFEGGKFRDKHVTIGFGSFKERFLGWVQLTGKGWINHDGIEFVDENGF